MKRRADQKTKYEIIVCLSFGLFWAEKSNLKISLKQRAEELSKMLFLECNFILRKSNDEIIFKAVVFRLLAQNDAITMYGQSRNEDFGKKKSLSRWNF